MAAQAQDLEPASRDATTSKPASSDDARATLFSRLTQFAFSAASEDESAQADASLAELVRTVAPNVRAKVAQSIATVAAPLPRLAGTLARDSIDIARPLLNASPMIDDDTLIDIVENSSADHRLAIAGRPGLSSRVTTDLVACQDPALMGAVAANPTASFTPKSLDLMARASEASAELAQTLLAREDLPPLSAHRMFWWVAGPFREKILRNHLTDIRDLRTMLSEAVDSGLIDTIASGAVDRVLATMMKHTRGPTTDLVTVLRRGSLVAFVEALQENLGIDVRTARRIVEDNGGEAVAVACRALDADRAQFTSIFLLLDYLRFGKARPVARLAQVSSIYDRVPHGRAAASVVMWTVLTQELEAQEG